jgi:hypothetical protein
LVSEQARALIRSAFERARESGKPDWRRMSLAVLKNRILQLTKQAFREQDFGAPTFLAFVRLFGDLLEIDEATRPLTVILRPGTPDSPAEGDKQLTLAPGDGQQLYVDSPGTRVRPDLWNAVMDYSSGTTFGWDSHQQRARPIEPDEDRPRLPTITAGDLQAWRNAFVAAHADTLTGANLEKLTSWRDQGLATNALPPVLRKPWNAELKKEAIQRLRAWFEAQSLPVPTLLVKVGGPEAKPGEDVEALRKYVLDCVRVMTKDELEELRLPARVLMRARNQ